MDKRRVMWDKRSESEEPFGKLIQFITMYERPDSYLCAIVELDNGLIALVDVIQSGLQFMYNVGGFPYVKVN